MKKSITETLNAFATNPIEAKQVYNKNSRHWYKADTDNFWNMAMKAHPNNTLKQTAYRLIDFLHENDLIDYGCIGWDYLNFYDECDGDCDMGLKTYTIDYITDNYNWWLEDTKGDEADELRNAVEEAEQVWYWPYLLSYCVDSMNYEYCFVKQVAHAAIH